MDLARLRTVPGLEDLANRACTQVSPLVHPELTHLSEVMEQVGERVNSAAGFDSASSTFVGGDTGIVVIDAKTSTENMARALLAFREIGELLVKGIVHTHSHGDHWAGSPALASQEAAASGEAVLVAQGRLMAEIGRINGFNHAATELVDAGRLEITGDAAAAGSFAGYFDPAPDVSRIRDPARARGLRGSHVSAPGQACRQVGEPTGSGQLSAAIHEQAGSPCAADSHPVEYVMSIERDYASVARELTARGMSGRVLEFPRGAASSCCAAHARWWMLCVNERWRDDSGPTS